MALVQWSDLGNQLYGRQGGSAIGQQGNNPTLIRNPTAANHLRNAQQVRRWEWSHVQRHYRNLSSGALAILTTCGQNNPYINSRHEIRYPNRYHKWLQVGVFWFTIVGDFNVPFAGNASPGADWYFEDVQLYTYFNPAYPANVIAITGEGVYVSGSQIDCGVFFYVSRPISNGVTSYTGTWVQVGTFNMQTSSLADEWPNVWWSLPYQVGDTVIFRADVIDMVRGFVISTQQQRIVLQGEP